MFALGRDDAHAMAGCGGTIDVSAFVQLHAVAADGVELLTIGYRAVRLDIIFPDFSSADI